MSSQPNDYWTRGRKKNTENTALQRGCGRTVRMIFAKEQARHRYRSQSTNYTYACIHVLYVPKYRRKIKEKLREAVCFGFLYGGFCRATFPDMGTTMCWATVHNGRRGRLLGRSRHTTVSCTMVYSYTYYGPEANNDGHVKPRIRLHHRTKI